MSAIGYILNTTITLVTVTQPSTGLGEICVLTPEGSSAISGGYTSYTSATEIDAAETANEITAQGAIDLKAVLSEAGSPSRVYVATYDDSTETPDDAADVILAGNVDVGVFVCRGDNADLAAMGTWLGTGQRRWAHKVFAQSSESSLLTASPSSALDDCQVSNFHLLYATTAEPTAAAMGGRTAGADMTVQQVAGRMSLVTPDEESITSAERTNVIANNCNVLLQQDAGSTANMTVGIVDYDGSASAVTTTLIYVNRRLNTEFSNLVSRYADLAKPIPYSMVGEALCEGSAANVLGDLAAVHFTPGTIGTGPDEKSLPDGYLVTTSRSSGNIVLTIDLIIAGEASQINLNITAQEAS